MKANCSRKRNFYLCKEVFPKHIYWVSNLYNLNNGNGLFQLIKIHSYGRALIKSGGFLAKNSLFLEGWQYYGKFNGVLGGGIQTVLIVSRGQISWIDWVLRGWDTILMSLERSSFCKFPIIVQRLRIKNLLFYRGVSSLTGIAQWTRLATSTRAKS